MSLYATDVQGKFANQMLADGKHEYGGCDKDQDKLISLPAFSHLPHWPPHLSNRVII